MTEVKNKTLWIFPNIKESVSYLPDNLQGRAWKLIIDYGFGDENCIENEKNNRVLQTFFAVRPLLRLRGIAGSQNGKSNNPSGLRRIEEPNIGPNIVANIGANLLKTETENKKEIKEINKEIVIDYDCFMERWNRSASRHDNMIAINLMNDDRKKKLDARFKDMKKNGKEPTIENFFKIIGTAYQNSEFLQGEKTGFNFTLDFVLQAKSFQKILENGYRDK